MRVRTFSKSRGLLAAATVAAFIAAPATASAHNPAVHQNMTDYAYELLLASALENSGGKTLDPAVHDLLTQLAKADPTLVTFYADAATAIPKLRALPSGLHPTTPMCQKKAFANANGGSPAPDWQLPPGSTLAEVPMGRVRYPINPAFGTSALDCGITEDWRPGGALDGVNHGVPFGQKPTLTSRDHTGLVLGYWAQDVDNRIGDWRLRSSLGQSFQTPAASAGIALGSSGVIFSTCMLACALFPPVCWACPIAGIVGPAFIIDKIQTTDFNSMESGDYVGFGHFVDVKTTVPGAALFDDKPGKFGERAGPLGVPDSTEMLVNAFFDAAGMHVNHATSDGPKNYEIMLGKSGGMGMDFHANSVHRTANEWEALTVAHTQLTPVSNLGMFGWQQFEGQLAAGAFQGSVGTVDKTLAARHLGEPLHALGDASVPQHGAGTSGWGHRPYEEAMENVYDEILGSTSGQALGVSLAVMASTMKRALVWRTFITDWRAAHPGLGKEVPVRDMITKLARNTFDKAMLNQAQIFNPNVSLEFQFGDSGAANAHYETATMKPILRDMLLDGIAAELAFLLSTTEVLP
jgi:hypothetical protein